MDLCEDDPVHTLNERRRAALEKVDQAPFSWFHVKVALVASVGFFTDAYDLFSITIATVMLGYVYRSSESEGWQLTQGQELGIKISAQIGTLVGQLLFGWLADVLGRKRMYGVELIIIIIGTFGQAVAGSAHAINIFAVIMVWRFLMGIGVGGDYPISAVVTSEFSSTRIRGRMMTIVFSAQGWGNFAAGAVALCIVSSFKPSLFTNDTKDLKTIDFMWRLLIGLGCIPGSIALYFRLTIPETPRFTMDIERDIQKASAEVEAFLENKPFDVDPDASVHRVVVAKGSRLDFFQYFSHRENLQMLIACAWSWFALDIAFYGLNLNTPTVLSALGSGGVTLSDASTTHDIYENLQAICRGNIILAIAGLIPGYYATFLFVDAWGRKPIQLMGFCVLTVLFAIMGFAHDRLVSSPSSKRGYVVLYCLANFFQNFGPNTTTFIIPGEAFPTRYRSTAHGISAASGKLGAIIAQVVVVWMKDIGGPDHFVPHILEIFAFLMGTGVISTLLLTETMNKSLEDLSNEKQEGYVKGTAQPVVLTDGHSMFVWTTDSLRQIYNPSQSVQHS